MFRPKPDWQENQDYGQRLRINLIVLAAMILLVAGTSWLLIEFRAGVQLFDCYAYGGKNCKSVIVWPPQREPN